MPRDESENLRGGNTPPSSEPPPVTLGTGFFVSEQGHILTSSHVVSGCRVIQTSNHEQLRILKREPDIDLALLIGEIHPPSIAAFRSGSEPRLGESVVVFGFPLPGLLTTEGNLSTGAISALKGVEDDPIFIQVSAPVQPGNSGGALLDEYGNVVGVVVAKLDAVEVAKVTGDIPQNVNFAVKWSQVTAFLDRAKVPYQTKLSKTILKIADIAAAARDFSVPIECVK
jgi:S1-C subfamily serine protease